MKTIALVFLMTVTAYTAAAWDYPPDILFDNGPFVTAVGAGAGGADVSKMNDDEKILGFGVQKNRDHKLADQFVVPAGETWNIESITLFAYQPYSGTSSTITAAYLAVYPGWPDEEEPVYGNFSTNAMTSTEWTNCYRCSTHSINSNKTPIMSILCEFKDLSLSEGEYWIAWTLEGSTELSGPYGNPVTIPDQSKTGDALWYVNSGWDSLIMLGPDTPVGVPFIITGSNEASLANTSWTGIKTAF